VSFGVFLKKISCVDGEGFAWWGRVWVGIRLELVPRRRQQFSRFACGFTPACGSKVSCEPMSQERDMGHPAWWLVGGVGWVGVLA
jgi:hypothetical protein